MPPSALDRLGMLIILYAFLIIYPSLHAIMFFMFSSGFTQHPLLLYINLFFSLAAYLQIDYPMLFEVSNPSSGKISHCGVLEFIADEGLIYLPYWVLIFPKCL